MIASTAQLGGVRVLVVEADAVAARSLATQVEALGGAVTHVKPGDDAVELVQRGATDVVIAAESSAELTLLSSLRQRGVSASVVAIASHGRVDTAVKAMRLGAVDFLVKPVDPERFAEALGRAVAKASLLGASSTRSGDELVGVCDAIAEARDTVESVAPADAPVLVVGPSGSGRSHVSRLLHQRSDRAGKLVTLDGSEATARRFNQAVAQAEAGTLVIEQGESTTKALVTSLQTLLDQSSESGPRVVFETTSSAKLERDAPGLAERLRAVRVELPGLVERGGDVVLLAEHLLALHAGKLKRRRRLSDASHAALRRYDWPGHVRELDAAMKGAAATSSHTEVDWQPPAAEAIHAGAEGTLAEQMEDAERHAIRAALDAEDWQRTATADRLGINRATLYKKMRALGLQS